MDKIYVVTSGCYSEYQIEMIFTNLEDAEKYCAFQNAKWYKDEDDFKDDKEEFSVEDLYFHWDMQSRIEEYPIDNAEIALNEKPMKKRYVYKRASNGEEHIYSCGVIYANKSFVKVTEDEDTKGCIEAAIVTDCDVSTEKLKKIIYDEIAKKRATVNFLI